MRIPSPSTKRRVRIEIIPLIDIVFFLLATFAIVSLSMIKNQGVSVNLPTAATASIQESKEIITITIKEKGEIYFDKEQITFEQLSKRLNQLNTGKPDLNILINGDKKAYFGSAVQVLDEVRRFGITKVSIRTKNE